MSNTKETSSVHTKVTIQRKLLIIASALTIMMAVPHFFVPFVFPWESLTGDLYPPVKWALFAMNFFFSLLLFWGGVISFAAAYKWKITRIMQYYLFGGMGSFWAIGGIYEILVPFPIVEAKFVLPGIAIMIASLYGIGLFKDS